MCLIFFPEKKLNILLSYSLLFSSTLFSTTYIVFKFFGLPHLYKIVGTPMVPAVYFLYPGKNNFSCWISLILFFIDMVLP